MTNKMNNLHDIALQINNTARNYRMASFQDIRVRVHGKQKKNSKGIFDINSISESAIWAYHYGGRSEIQYNIGFEKIQNKECLRFGLAFSLEPSRTLPKEQIVQAFKDKIKRYNDFISINKDRYNDIIFWSEKRGQVSPIAPIKEIEPESLKSGDFYFVGRYVPVDTINYNEILGVLDRLLDIYIYVEGNNELEEAGQKPDGQLLFVPGCSIWIDKEERVQSESKYDVFLRHKVIQKRIYDLLEKEYGAGNVGAENRTGFGTMIDIVVKESDTEYQYYEIKTSSSVKSCIREALSQLLEYAYWPNSIKASKLIIVSENKITKEAKEYLAFLRTRFNMPVFYQRFLFDQNKLSPLE